MGEHQTGSHKIYIFRPQIHSNQWVNIKLDRTKYISLGLRYTATNGCTPNWITQNIYLRPPIHYNQWMKIKLNHTNYISLA